MVLRRPDLLVGPSIKAGIKYGKDLFKQTLGSSSDAFGLACTETEGLEMCPFFEI